MVFPVLTRLSPLNLMMVHRFHVHPFQLMKPGARAASGESPRDQLYFFPASAQFRAMIYETKVSQL